MGGPSSEVNVHISSLIKINELIILTFANSIANFRKLTTSLKNRRETALLNLSGAIFYNKFLYKINIRGRHGRQFHLKYLMLRSEKVQNIKLHLFIYLFKCIY
ncbi:MAG: hypothetical protein AABW83_01700 [Nanoarchaeota archaeon]